MDLLVNLIMSSRYMSFSNNVAQKAEGTSHYRPGISVYFQYCTDVNIIENAVIWPLFLLQVYKQLEEERPKCNTSFSDSSSIAGSEYAKQRVENKNRIQKAIARTDYKLLLIPIVFMLMRMWGTTRYFISMHGKNTRALFSPPLLYLQVTNYYCTYMHCYFQALGDPLQGFGNAVLFILFSKVILKRMCAPVIMCFRCCSTCFTSKCDNSGGITVSKDGTAIIAEDGLLRSSSSLSGQYGSILNRPESRNSINT